MDPVADILDELSAGRMIVLADDASRENEGDLVVAAEHATPEAINFMLTEGRGMMCVALDGPTCDRLALDPLSRVNTSQRSTAYTVTVDAAERFGITTGVSANDRSTTTTRLADPDATPRDFDRPGHVQPLRSRDGGVLVRAGQTEGSVDLCKLAGLRPAAVIIEVMNADGTMARRDDLARLCDTHRLKMCTVADVIQHRLEQDRLVERIADQPIDTAFGPFRLIAYRAAVDSLPHVALVKGDLARWDDRHRPIDRDDPVLVRMHSQNLLGDVFAETTTHSSSTLRAAMRMIQQRGRGAIVYLRHERMGTGLLRELQTLRHPTGSPLDDAQPDHPITGPTSTDDAPSAATTTTTRRDQAAYGIGSQILRDLGVRRLELITDHPFTPTALSGFGLTIDRFVPVEPAPA
ncbi:MAG: 3,4-dihydroxy-2-butanone-4-phosphate synthase [Planctomycetota bacterium]